MVTDQSGFAQALDLTIDIEKVTFLGCSNLCTHKYAPIGSETVVTEITNTAESSNEITIEAWVASDIDRRKTLQSLLLETIDLQNFSSLPDDSNILGYSVTQCENIKNFQKRRQSEKTGTYVKSYKLIVNITNNYS